MSPDQILPSPRSLESRFANPFVARVLDSPAHPLLSHRLLLVSYAGRKSGNRYTTPTLYWHGSRSLPEYDVVLMTPAGSTNWWRNFRGGHPLRVLVRGEWHEGTGTAVTDRSAVETHFRGVADPVRRWSYVLTGRSVPSSERVADVASTFVLVGVTFE